MKVEVVYGMTGCIQGFRPKPLWHLVLSQQRSYHINVTPRFKGQTRVRLICAPKNTNI
jgi:hypothetical protein